MVADRVFVDTNVLVYSSLQHTALHSAARLALESLRKSPVELWISRQVLREYIVTLTRPQGTTLASPVASVVADIARFQSILHIADDHAAVTTNLVTLLQTFPLRGKQVHDANIVATMQAYGISKLLTHNTSDFERFSSLITILPLTP